MNLSIRPASETDLDFVAWVQYTAAKSHLDRSIWELMYGRPEPWIMELLRRTAVSPELHWCHLSKFWICEADGVRAGALAGYDPATEGNDVLTTAMLAAVAAMGDADLDLDAVLRRASIAEGCTPKRHPGAWGVENVAVVEGMRGRGILDRLMAHVLGLGRERGFSRAQIMCLRDNVRALRAYEREGFELCADYRSDEFEQEFSSGGIKLLVQRL